MQTEQWHVPHERMCDDNSNSNQRDDDDSMMNKVTALYVQRPNPEVRWLAFTFNKVFTHDSRDRFPHFPI